MVLPSAGNVYTVVVNTMPRFPEEYIVSTREEPMSSQYAVAFPSALQVNVAEVPLRVVPGIGDS